MDLKRRINREINTTTVAKINVGAGAGMVMVSDVVFILSSLVANEMGRAHQLNRLIDGMNSTLLDVLCDHGLIDSRQSAIKFTVFALPPD